MTVVSTIYDRSDPLPPNGISHLSMPSCQITPPPALPADALMPDCPLLGFSQDQPLVPQQHLGSHGDGLRGREEVWGMYERKFQ